MTTPPEFSRPLPIERIGRDGKAWTVEASEAERAALARRFDLVALDRLIAEVEVTRDNGGTYRLTATIEAAVVQSCVVSLEPVAADIRDRQTHLFAIEDEGDDDLEEDGPEPIVDGQIDVGEVVAQQLALALPAYPRAPDATVAAVAASLPSGVTICSDEEISDDGDLDADAVSDPASTLAGLARWKRP